MAARQLPHRPAPQPCWPDENSASIPIRHHGAFLHRSFDDECGLRGLRAVAAGQSGAADGHDVEAAARRWWHCTEAPQAGITIRGVRLDSGDPIALSPVRAILDADGLQAVTIFASGGLDEDDLAVLRENAPIGGLGISTAATSSDVPRSMSFTNCRNMPACRG